MGDAKRKGNKLNMLHGMADVNRDTTGAAICVLVDGSDQSLTKARDDLGGVSFLFDRATLTLASAEDRAKRLVCWIHHPSPEQQDTATMHTRSAELQEMGGALLAMRAARRGVEMRLIAYCDSELEASWRAQFEGWKDIAAQAASASRPTLKVQRVMDPKENSVNLSLVTVPNATLTMATLRDILKAMDRFTADKQTALKRRQSMLLNFEGYDDDPRELWEIPEVRSFMVDLEMAAPEWPWVVHPSNHGLWLGCSVRHEMAKDEDGKLKLVFDQDELTAKRKDIGVNLRNLVGRLGIHDQDAHQSMIEIYKSFTDPQASKVNVGDGQPNDQEQAAA